MRDGCVFCDYEGPSEVTQVSPSVYSIEPLNPVISGHRLFIPYRHIDIHDDLDRYPEHRRYFYIEKTMREAASYVRENKIQANIITSVGEAATQTVFHLHLHVIPRAVDDGLALPWSESGIDWKGVFSKYLDVVLEAEGVDFLYDHQWSDEEWGEIQKVAVPKYSEEYRESIGLSSGLPPDGTWPE